MSSFINNSKHFACTRETINYLYSKREMVFEYDTAQIVPEFTHRKGFARNIVEAKITEIMHTIIDLQVTCVFLQYKHHYVGTLDQDIRNTKVEIKACLNTGKILTKVELFKAIQSMFYQIETEHLTDLRPLFQKEETVLKFFEVLENALAHNIVTHTEEYEKAEWNLTE